MKKNVNKCTENHYSNINKQTDAAIAVERESQKKCRLVGDSSLWYDSSAVLYQKWSTIALYSTNKLGNGYLVVNLGEDEGKIKSVFICCFNWGTHWHYHCALSSCLEFILCTSNIGDRCGFVRLFYSYDTTMFGWSDCLTSEKLTSE